MRSERRVTRVSSEARTEAAGLRAGRAAASKPLVAHSLKRPAAVPQASSLKPQAPSPTSRKATAFPLLIFLLGAVMLAGACTRGSISKKPPIHINPNMDIQPKAMPEASSDFFADGKTMRPKLAGTVAREDAVDDHGLSSGKDAAGNYLKEFPMKVDGALLTRGQQRFDIYCAPCHGERADGNGMLHQRANVRVANLLDPRIVAMPPGQIVDTIDNGLGLMPSYRYPIPPHDRWAIVAWVKKLQAQQASSGASADEEAGAGSGSPGTAASRQLPAASSPSQPGEQRAEAGGRKLEASSRASSPKPQASSPDTGTGGAE